jgi:uncharacterized repeat protein (TIGR01451 family)
MLSVLVLWADPAPALTAYKSVALLVDADSNGVPSPGDTLGYTVTITNTGGSEITGVSFSDTPDSNTTLVAGMVQTTQGTVTGGNGGTPPVAVDVGTIPGGGSVTITFRVTINSPLPVGVTQVANQGLVNSSELPGVLTDDPNTLADGDATLTNVFPNPTPTPTPTITATPTETATPTVTPTPCVDVPADVVFILDTSFTMRRYVRVLLPTYLASVPETLSASGIDWRLGVVRFGTGKRRAPDGPDTPNVALDFTTSGDTFRAVIADLPNHIYGPTESGTEAIDLALSSMALRPGVAHMFVMFSNENDDLPISIVRDRHREPPGRWLTSSLQPTFQARLDSTAQGLIDAQVMVDFVVNPRRAPSSFQYGSPWYTVVDPSGRPDLEATLAALTGAQREQSLQGQLLGAGVCSGGSCTRGRVGKMCTADIDCGLWARAFDIRGVRILHAPLFFQSIVGDVIAAVGCGP